MKQFLLPDPGEGLVEAEIVTWRVAVGDQVQVNDIVVEIETSKSLVELPVPYAGTVSALLANEGDLVEVGAPIISIDDGTSPAPQVASGPAPQVARDTAPPVARDTAPPVVRDTAPQDALPSTQDDDGEEVGAGLIGGEAPGGRVAVLVGYGPRTAEAKRRPRKSAAERPDRETHEQVADTFSTSAPVSFRGDERRPLTPGGTAPVGAPLPGPGSPPSEGTPRRGAILAKPPVRKLAKDLGLDLTTVEGTGAGGVITRGDVESAARASREAPASVASATAPTRPAPAAGADVRIPVKGVRKATAEAMVSSAFTAPHVTEWVTCDVTATMELLERVKSRREFAQVKVSPLLLVAKAVCLALSRNPQLNSSFDAEAGEIVLKGVLNLGVAAATPRGLLVPNIKDAQRLTLLELAEAINSLVAVAREGRTQPADTAGGTFTITNVGVFGIDAGTPILNPGEAGILCLGTIARRPWVVGTGAEERLEPRWVTTLALSFDHRVVDGEQGSRFLADVAQVLSEPALALLF